MVKSISLPKTICNELRGLVKDTVGMYGDNIQKIILFGSFATNRYQPDSDFDICLVLSKLPNSNLDILKMRNLADDCNTSRNVDVVLCSSEELENGDMVFRHIRSDGVILYEQV